MENEELIQEEQPEEVAHVDQQALAALLTVEEMVKGPQMPERVPPRRAGTELRLRMDATVKACFKEVQEVLEFHGCEIVGESYITPEGKIGARVSVRVVVGGPPRP